MLSKTLLCWCAIALLNVGYLPAQSINLERLGATEGLSQGMIYDLLQDHHGFLWFATKDGLNRYDGYSFHVFQNKPNDPFSLTDNEIKTIFEDQLGRIWVGTVNNGLNVLDPPSGKFYHLNNLSSQSITSLAQTSDGTIWVGTAMGINRLWVPETLPINTPDLESVTTVDTLYWNDHETSPISPNHPVVDLAGSKDGKIWVSTPLQVGFFDPQTGDFQKIWSNSISENGEYLSSFLQEGPDGTMWIGQPGQLICVQKDSIISVFRLPETSVFPYTDIAFDASGNLFISTRKQIFKLPISQVSNPRKAHFELIYRFSPEGVIGSTKMIVDRSGLLWIGTTGYGLLKYNPGNPNFHHYLKGRSPRRIFIDLEQRVWVWHSASVFSRLVIAENRSAESIYSGEDLFQFDCIQAKDERIWLLCGVKTKRKGEGILVQLHPKTLDLVVRYPIPVNTDLFSRLYEGPDGNLWILGSKSTLLKFDPQNSQCSVFDFSGVTGFSEVSFSLSIDTTGHIWIGTPHGLVHAVPEGQGLKFLLSKNVSSNSKSLFCNFVLTTFNDPVNPEDYCWLGTKGGGLNLLDKHTGVFRHFTTADGLPNNVVYAMLPDDQGALWLSTNYGLSKFNPKTGIFQNFFNVDGLQDNEFNTLSFARAADGLLYFGGVNGITAFYPSAINSSSTVSPPVFITRLKINNLPAIVGDGVLKNIIEETSSIALNYQQNQLTFEFAAMDFSAPRMNQFRYRLQGVDQDWVESTTTNSATYAHLAPGNYVFEVITGGSRGIWNGTPARLEIQISPPWWRKGWAYMLYMLALALLSWGIYRFQMNKIRLENKLQFEQREAIRLSELDQLKTNFFSSVTHEFRTPLSLLLEPARQLLIEAKDFNTRYRLKLIESNALRLLHFVNQLLDLSKLEAGQMPLDLRIGELESTIRTVVERLQLLALQRSVTLQIVLPEVPVQVMMDENKWEQVLVNLLSNALKFTDKGGIVSLILEAHKTKEASQMCFCVEVRDTGIGISSKDLPHIFDRFYQAAQPNPELRDGFHSKTKYSSPPFGKPSGAGTGIGLALVKELVECLGGSISVKSRIGVGTTFSVKFFCEMTSIQKSHSKEEKSSHKIRLTPNLTIERKVFSDRNDVSSTKASAPLLLLIEDDTELRHFLRASLPSSYRIIEAADGEAGIEMALEFVPDLIICDLVMPKKNGYEVIKTLKNTLSTSHIPIVLLTAKSAFESKIQGLRQGADVYLTKPFRADELGVHIENLIASRKQLQKYFLQSIQNASAVEIGVVAIPPQENEFLQRLIQVVDENLSNEKMDADAFARAVFMSRSQLHRKINALTGISLTEFIRNYRLDKAHDMLVKRDGTVAQIAWRTGFPNAPYFSTRFKERFGITPGRVAKRE